MYRNDYGNGSFTDVMNGVGEGLGIAQETGEDFYGPHWVDYDNDGDLDLSLRTTIPSQQKNVLNIYTNDEATFSRTHSLDVEKEDESGISFSMVWADFNNDGFLDVYLPKVAGKTPSVPVTGQSRNLLYCNISGGTGRDFVEVGEDVGVDGRRNTYGAAWGDIDNDGDLDLYAANSTEGSKQPNNLFVNFDDGALFDDRASEAGIADIEGSRNGTWADFDLDGDLDMYLPNVHAPDRLYRNE